MLLPRIPSDGRPLQQHTKPSLPDLPTLTENLPAEIPDIHDEVNAEAQIFEDFAEAVEDERDGLRPPSPDNLSNLSGATTAVTSFSRAVIKDLQPELMLSELPDLNDGASKILRLVAPEICSTAAIASIVEQLQMPQSVTSKLLTKRGSTFERFVEDFKFSDRHYLRPNNVVRAMLGVLSDHDIGTGHWRPDNILYRANLASLAVRILTPQLGVHETYATLQVLDDTFPRDFLSAYNLPASTTVLTGHSSLLRKTFIIGLDVRTQLVILLLRSRSGQPSFDPANLIDQVFVAPSGQASTNKPVVRTIADLGENDVMDNVHSNIVMNRIVEIKRYLMEHENSVDFEGLAAKFPWSDFQHAVIDWISARAREVDQQITEAGGTEAISQKLEEEIGSRGGRKSGTLLTRSVNAKEVPPVMQMRMFSGAGKYLNDMNIRLSTEGGLTPLNTGTLQQFVFSGRPASSATDNNCLAPALGEEDQDAIDGKGPDIRGPAVERHELEHALLEQVNDDRRTARPALIDRQINAIRINFEDTQSGNDTTTALPSSNSKQPAQSAYDEVSSSVDVGFQPFAEESGPQRGRMRQLLSGTPESSGGKQASVQEHTISPANRARHHSAQELRDLDENSQQPAKRPRTTNRLQQSQDSNYNAEDDEDDEDTDDPEKPKRTRPPMSSNYTQIQTQSRERTAINSQGKKPQARKAWTLAETDALTYYIGRYGCRWSRIQRKDLRRFDGILGERSQGDLKDKAKNMKYDYIRSVFNDVGLDIVNLVLICSRTRVTLPRKFENIMLDKKFKVRLRDAGIDYEQDQIRRREQSHVI